MSPISDKTNLRLPLKMGIAKFVHFDFHRFRYKNVPNKRDLPNGEYANRDSLVLKWFKAIQNSEEYTDQTKNGYICDFVKYVRLIDQHNLLPESQAAVELWEQHLVEKVRLGSMHVNTARKLLSSTKSLFQILELPVDDWFSKYGLFRSEINPTRGYSDLELKQLIKILHTVFRQLSKQILADPQYHALASIRQTTSNLTYRSTNVKVAATVTKCFVSAYFLMAFYTWANCTTLLRMKKPRKSALKNSSWYSQSIFKPRANKYVTIAIGENESFHVPKHALKIIESVIKLSTVIGPDEDHLFFQVKEGVLNPLEPSHLRHFTNWLLEHFELKTDDGEPLRPEAKRFRASGSTRYLIATGNTLETSLILGNTPNTLSKHYTSGNESDNMQQLQAACFTLEGATKCADIPQAKEYAKHEMQIEVLPYEEFISKYSKLHAKPNVTPIGSGCKNPYGSEAEKFRTKVNFSPKSITVDHLACSDILNCFTCPNQVIIEEVDDIWCLLSFKEAIEESRNDHINSLQFQRNFSEILAKIDHAIFSINPKIKRRATKKLLDEGRHPLWPAELNSLF